MDSFNLRELQEMLHGGEQQAPTTEVMPAYPNHELTPQSQNFLPQDRQERGAQAPNRELPDVMVFHPRKGFHPEDIREAFELLGLALPAQIPVGKLQLDATIFRVASKLNDKRLQQERADFDRRVAEVTERKRQARIAAEAEAEARAMAEPEGEPPIDADEVYREGIRAGIVASKQERKRRNRKIGGAVVGMAFLPALAGAGWAVVNGHTSPDGIARGISKPYLKVMDLFSAPNLPTEQPINTPIVPATTEMSPTTLPTLSERPTSKPRITKPIKTIDEAQPTPVVTITVTPTETVKPTPTPTATESATQPLTGTPTPSKSPNPTATSTGTAGPTTKATTTKASATTTTKPTASKTTTARP